LQYIHYRTYHFLTVYYTLYNYMCTTYINENEKTARSCPNRSYFVYRKVYNQLYAFFTAHAKNYSFWHFFLPFFPLKKKEILFGFVPTMSRTGVPKLLSEYLFRNKHAVRSFFWTSKPLNFEHVSMTIIIVHSQWYFRVLFNGVHKRVNSLVVVAWIYQSDKD